MKENYKPYTITGSIGVGNSKDSNKDFDFSKQGDQDKFNKLPEEEKKELVNEAHAEAKGELTKKEITQIMVAIKKNEYPSNYSARQIGEAIYESSFHMDVREDGYIELLNTAAELIAKNYDNLTAANIILSFNHNIACDYAEKHLEEIERIRTSDEPADVEDQEYFASFNNDILEEAECYNILLDEEKALEHYSNYFKLSSNHGYGYGDDDSSVLKQIKCWYGEGDFYNKIIKIVKENYNDKFLEEHGIK